MIARLRDLRWRVTLATALLGATMSLGFAVAAFQITEKYESVLVTEMLRGQARDYGNLLALQPGATLPRGERLNGYLRRRDGTGDVPADLLALGPGFHEEMPRGGRDVTVGVFDLAQGRAYFVLNLDDIETLEDHLDKFLAASVLAGTALAAWLGWFLAGLSLAPVRRLADIVDALPPSPRVTALARVAGDDELGRLAAAIDRYQARLVDADAEERRFFADASHELRTPIAVVRGVTELILDDPDAHADQRRWLARLDRGMAELTGLIDALLGVARGRTSEVEDVPVRALVAAAVESVDAARNCALHLDVAADLHWPLPRREAQLVLRTALAALLGADTEGKLRIEATDRELAMTFAPREAGPAPATRGDQGLGSTLVDRLARTLGWSIVHASAADGSRSVRITVR